MELIVDGNFVVIDSKGFYSTILNAGFLAGSRFDPSNKLGLSHLVEHLFVNTIDSVSSGSNRVFNFISEIDGRNDREISRCWIRTTNSYTKEAIDRFFTVLGGNNLFDQLFENEKKTIIGAALQNENNSDPYQTLIDKSFEVLFGKRNPLSNLETGSSKTANDISLDDCYQHFFKHYQNGRNCIVIACDLNKIDVLSYIKNYNKLHKKDIGLNDIIVQTVYKPVKPKSISLSMNAGTVELSLATCLKKSKLFPSYFIDFVCYMLGKTTNSILFKLLREKNGLVYDVNCKTYHFTNLSVFTIYAGISEVKSEEKVINLIFDVLINLKQYLDESMLSLFKLAYCEQYLMNCDNLLNYTNKIIDMALSGSPIYSPVELVAKIQKITLSEIEYFINKQMNPDCLSKIRIE